LTGSKKNLVCSAAQKRLLIDTKHPKISVVRQCRLLGLSHSSLYYHPVQASAENLSLMRLLDEEYTQHPLMHGSIYPRLPPRAGRLEIINHIRGKSDSDRHFGSFCFWPSRSTDKLWLAGQPNKQWKQ
jgi:hypothetical protein